MATRTIITSQPDVACDVCERRLLRGEQPDIFIAAGRRRIVCELCAPRAAHEGWLRESQAEALALPPMRPRRGRSLFDKLRQVGKPPAEEPLANGAALDQELEPAGFREPYDFLEGYEAGGVDADPRSAEDGGAHAEESLPVDGDSAPRSEFAFTDFDVHETSPAGSDEVQQAIDIFNSSEYPRRVAGVARSLGPPAVNVRLSDHVDGAVSIVVAWELCWYRYEVDLGDGAADARVIAQGTELSELAAVEQLANAVADESGVLAVATV